MLYALDQRGERRLIKEMRVRYYRVKQLQKNCPSFPLEKELPIG
jgi:hypothetical protein